MIIVNPPYEKVAKAYQDFNLLWWDNISLSFFKDLQALPVHTAPRWKKMKSKDIFAPINDLKKHPMATWAGNVEHAEFIQRMMRVTENEVRNIVRQWFNPTQLGDEMHSWRFTLTKDEPLHFDVYADRVREKVLRVFINMDDEDRVWDVGPVNYPGNKDQSTYDQAYKAGVLKNVPTERVKFPPGTVWAVDSRRVSHAIIYGKRACMLSWELKGIPY